MSNFGVNTFYSIIYIIIITTWGGYMTKEEMIKLMGENCLNLFIDLVEDKIESKKEKELRV